MNEVPKILEQKINTIDEMISFAKQKFVDYDVGYMIFSGWALFLFYMLNGFERLGLFKNTPIERYIDLALPLLLLSVCLYGIKSNNRFTKTYTHTNYGKKIQNIIGAGIILGAAVVGVGMWILQGKFFDTPYFALLFLAMYGSALFIYSRLAEYKWVSWFSFPIWAVALVVASLIKQGIWINWQFPIAFVFLLGSVVPGHIIKHKSRHENTKKF